MTTKTEPELYKITEKLGFDSSGEDAFVLLEWLREAKEIHLEIGGIWDELHNKVLFYCYTISAPICKYYQAPVTCTGGKSHREMLLTGLDDALKMLKQYEEQRHFIISDDEVIIAYLKGYGDKDFGKTNRNFKTNLEKYAYALGRAGDYIEEGLSEENIVTLVRNEQEEPEIREIGE
ncbi:hypothetical protein [Salinimicrobium oceani]|uniref:Uncharacterized protein n=1 Tax=Salinimicrobium oceani TaxID=2722702 RepID=A0ABX1CYQ2_9FLAO|nr:hypothetical protein [Salinimicrobium oceani]NJW53395.1 hypothetical protein [Salinimicrobium oceani]